ncbi:SIR2 family protein [Raoultella terrigena]|uniref:SIR2 family protein n=1 Tax=Raoultella terrigena TaxID=577 RepID=UPI002DB89DE6|nr:SIR2 family protein [Raoultella terrigena]MEB8193584.1 SIR2 family protein [Raoultella terrigena]
MIYNEDLINDLAQQKVVLFLGSGVSSSVNLDAINRFKGWPEFLEEAAKDRSLTLKKQIKNLLKAKDYLLACELLQADYGDAWERKVTEEYGRAAQPSVLHKALISLRQRIILTTNFDKLIESAWASSLADGERHFKVISKVDNDIFKVLKEHDTSYIIKIHGSIDDVSNIVFSRSQYIRLAFGNENYSLFLDSLLLNYTFLFVGFSMDDPAITSLMELYAYKYPKSRPHYIITSNKIPQNIRDIHRRLRRLIVMPYDPKDNHEELPKLVETMAGKVDLKIKANIATLLAKAK